MNFRKNLYQCVGNVVKEPVLKEFKKTLIAEFTLVTDGKVKKEGDNWVREPAFLDMKLIGTRAEEFCKRVTKGSKIYVEASIEQDNWDDKTTGQKRSKLVFKVHENSVLLLANYDNNGDSGTSTKPDSDTGTNKEDEDTPF